jgi:hypothetical protein
MVQRSNKSNLKRNAWERTSTCIWSRTWMLRAPPANSTSCTYIAWNSALARGHPRSYIYLAYHSKAYMIEANTKTKKWSKPRGPLVYFFSLFFLFPRQCYCVQNLFCVEYLNLFFLRYLSHWSSKGKWSPLFFKKRKHPSCHISPFT